MFGPWILAAGLLQAAPAPQETEGRVTPGSERHSALQIQISGRLDPHYLYREGSINEAGAVLNGAGLGDRSSTTAWSGRVDLRADLSLKDQVSGVIELQNRNVNGRVDRFFSSNPETDEINIRQGYVNVSDFVTPGLAFRIGVQNVTYRNRAHDEPFFIDLGESESFFGGFSSAAGGHVRNSVDRDVQQATGVKGTYSVADVAMAQVLAVVYGEGGATSSDESVYALVLNATPAEDVSAWILATLVSGGTPHLGEIWTLGAGVDAFLGQGKAFEIFAEAYLQGGTLVDNGTSVDKKAYAFNLGGRYVAQELKLWVEAGGSFRSGNTSVTDGRDQAFQSCENENRFVILQSAEFGLDVDTNLRLLRAAVGYGPIDVAGRPLRLRLDVGDFTADEVLRDAAGAAGSTRDWGMEGDFTATWSYNDSLSLWVQTAWLSGSKILEDLTQSRDDEAQALVAGADLKF